MMPIGVGSTMSDPAQPAPTVDGFSRRARQLGVDVGSPLSVGPFVVDLGSYVATRDGNELDMSPRQLELLALFLAAPRKVWSREELSWVCWGDSSASRRVDVQLCRLRARSGGELLRNVRDRGWALRA